MNKQHAVGCSGQPPMGMLLLQGRCTPASLSPCRERAAPHTPWARAHWQPVTKRQLTWSICTPKMTSQELCTGTVFQAEIYPSAMRDLISLVPCLLTLPLAFPPSVCWCFQYRTVSSFKFPSFRHAWKVSTVLAVCEAHAVAGEEEMEREGFNSSS